MMNSEARKRATPLHNPPSAAVQAARDAAESLRDATWWNYDTIEVTAYNIAASALEEFAMLLEQQEEADR